MGNWCVAIEGAGMATHGEAGVQATVAEAQGGTISLCADVPEPLLLAMRRFIEAHPNWDQYRLFKAA